MDFFNSAIEVLQTLVIALGAVSYTHLDVYKRQNYAKEISALIREAYGNNIKVFSTDIPRSVRAAEISAEGKSIFQHDPKGKVAEAYRILTKEVLSDAEKRRKRQLEHLR